MFKYLAKRNRFKNMMKNLKDKYAFDSYKVCKLEEFFENSYFSSLVTSVNHNTPEELITIINNAIDCPEVILLEFKSPISTFKKALFISQKEDKILIPSLGAIGDIFDPEEKHYWFAKKYYQFKNNFSTIHTYYLPLNDHINTISNYRNENFNNCIIKYLTIIIETCNDKKKFMVYYGDNLLKSTDVDGINIFKTWTYNTIGDLIFPYGESEEFYKQIDIVPTLDVEFVEMMEKNYKNLSQMVAI